MNHKKLVLETGLTEIDSIIIAKINIRAQTGKCAPLYQDRTEKQKCDIELQHNIYDRDLFGDAMMSQGLHGLEEQWL